MGIQALPAFPVIEDDPVVPILAIIYLLDNSAGQGFHRGSFRGL